MKQKIFNLLLILVFALIFHNISAMADTISNNSSTTKSSISADLAALPIVSIKSDTYALIVSNPRTSGLLSKGCAAYETDSIGGYTRLSLGGREAWVPSDSIGNTSLNGKKNAQIAKIASSINQCKTASVPLFLEADAYAIVLDNTNMSKLFHKGEFFTATGCVEGYWRLSINGKEAWISAAGTGYIINDKSNESTSCIKAMQAETNVPTNKTWKIKFNKPVDSGTVTSQNIIVTNTDGNPANVKITYNKSENEVVISAPSGGYDPDTTYELGLSQDVESKAGQPLDKIVTMRFTTAYSTANLKTHSDLQKNLYIYLMNNDNRNSTLQTAIELHDGDTSNNCVYFASEALRRAGLSSLPDYVCNTVDFTNRLSAMGWTKSTNLSKLLPGDICFTVSYGNGPTHTYVFMKWVNAKSYDYAYICDNQNYENGNVYHVRNINFSTSTKDKIQYFMYK